MALLWIVVEEIPALLSPSYSLYQVVWMRYGVHLLFLLLYLAARGKLTLVRTAQPGLQIGRGLLMLAMPFFFIDRAWLRPRQRHYGRFLGGPLHGAGTRCAAATRFRTLGNLACDLAWLWRRC